MARLTISQTEFDSLEPLTKRELLAFIRDRLLAKSPGRPSKPDALTPSERVKRYRERKRKEEERERQKALKKH